MSENGKQKSTCNNQEYFYSVLCKGSTFFQTKNKTDEHFDYHISSSRYIFFQESIKIQETDI